jgi:hypothetical protein
MKCDCTKILAVFLVLLPSLGMAAEQTMGRLFFTPGQRARMDVARQQERSIKFDLEQEDSAPPPANLTLNGVITRSDGKATVWINNKEQSGEKAGSGIAVPRRGKPAGQVSVTTPDARRAVPLKVGQSIDMSSGQVEESYRRAPPASPPGRRDDAPDPPADVQGEIPPPR